MTKMDSSYRRLLDAIEHVLGERPDGTTRLGELYGEAPQVPSNWQTRGVPKARAQQAQEKWGISSVWILKGTGPMMLGQSDLSQDVRDQRATIAAVMRIVHELRDISVEPFTSEQEIRVADAALDVVLEVGADAILNGDQLQPATRQVAAVMRSR